MTSRSLLVPTLGEEMPRLEHGEDGIEHRIQILHDVVIPEPEDAVAHVTRKASRTRSCSLSACRLPSISTTSLRSRQRKSAKYGPIGSWRTNLCPASCRLLSRYQSLPSASVWARRRCRAFAVLGLFAPRMINLERQVLYLSPRAGRGRLGRRPSGRGAVDGRAITSTPPHLRPSGSPRSRRGLRGPLPASGER